MFGYVLFLATYLNRKARGQHWKSKLKFGIEIEIEIVKEIKNFKLEIEIVNRNWKSKLEIEFEIWNLKLKLKIKIDN